MLSTLPLLLTLAAIDPRQAVTALQLAGRPRDALTVVQQEQAERPLEARQLGFDYLRGHLLDLLGRTADGLPAFVDALSATPRLAFYCRYRLASSQVQLGHPEVAAGLLATGLATEPGSPLAPDAVRLLVQSLGRGGDCRLLRGFRVRQLGAPERRAVLLAQADCDLRAGAVQPARTQLIELLEENREDDVARLAADRLGALVSDAERGKVPLLLSGVFFQHREFDRAIRQLAHLFATIDSKGKGPTPRELAEARYSVGRAHFAQGRFELAARSFGALADAAPSTGEKARALLQQGRCFEMMGDWKRAPGSFRLAFLAEPGGEWAAPALLALLRLEWRSGNEATSTSVLAMLASSPKWHDSARRAALFLAASDLVRGRAERAGAWLERAAAGSLDEERPEVAYWRGRLAELQGKLPEAVAAYLTGLRADVYHPLSRAALLRLAAEPLATAARTEGRRLASSHRVQELSDALLLLPVEDPQARLADKRLRTLLLADAEAGPYLRMAEVPLANWPLWSAALRKPEEMLLGLGDWREGAPAVRDHFPPGDPSLALTGSLLLARSGDTARSIALAEAMRDKMPAQLPLALLPAAFHRVLYPLAYREPLFAEGRLRHVDPYLMAALIRIESRFDHQLMSPSAARGLTQFVLPTARHVAVSIGMDHLDADDLDRPEVAIDLAGAYLAQLLRTYRASPQIAIAAYDAGESQAVLWRNYCFSPEPEEYFTKVGSRETRLQLARILGAWVQYQHLYG